MRRLIAFAFLSVFLLAPISGSADALDTRYRLGPEDRVRVRVTEWRATRSEPYAWESVTGEYSVDASGRLSLPFVGAIEVGGRTTEELSTMISDQLQRKVGLVQRPDAAVEVAEYRPIYVVGQVDKPGAYPYRPRLTVLQAIGLAGGYYRSPALGLQRLARESIGAQGDLREAQTERLALLARRARLEAEKNGDATIVFPAEVNDNGGSAATAAVREESALFESRREALRSQIVAITQAKALLNTEIDSLQAKMSTQDRQIALARKDLANINGLFDRGLAASQRQLQVEQMVAQLESVRIDSQVALSRARQEISRNDRAILDLKSQQQNTVLTDLRETQLQLSKLQQKADTARGLLADTATTGPRMERARRNARQRLFEYTLVRSSAQGADEISVGDTTPMQPGDVLKVTVPNVDDDPDALTLDQDGAKSLAQIR